MEYLLVIVWLHLGGQIEVEPPVSYPTLEACQQMRDWELLDRNRIPLIARCVEH